MNFYKMEEHKLSKLQICGIIASMIFSFCLVIVTFLNWDINNKSYFYNFRPYVSIKAASLKVVSDTQLQLRLLLSNTGRVPANNIDVTNRFCIDDKEIPTLQESEKATFIPPEVEVLNTQILHLTSAVIKDIFKGSSKLKVKTIIYYDGIGTKNHKTESSGYYGYQENSFVMEEGYAN